MKPEKFRLRGPKPIKQPAPTLTDDERRSLKAAGAYVRKVAARSLKELNRRDREAANGQ